MKRKAVFLFLLVSLAFPGFGNGVSIYRNEQGLTIENFFLKAVLLKNSNFQVNEIYLKGEKVNLLRPGKYGAIGIRVRDEERWYQPWLLSTLNKLEYEEVKEAEKGKIRMEWKNPLLKAEEVITLKKGSPILFIETTASFCKVTKIEGFNYPYIEMSGKEDFIYPSSSGIKRVKKEKWDKPKRKWVKGENWQGKWAGLENSLTHRGILLFVEKEEKKVALFGGLSLGLHWRNYMGRIVDEKTEPFHVLIGLMPFKGDLKNALEKGLKFWEEYKRREE